MLKQKQQDAGILSGLRVVELGHYIAAPVTGLILAEQGAEIIQIINPAEDSPDPLLDAILARGKHQIVLNLNSDENKKKLIELLKSADVVIENYAPKTFEKFGINFDEIRAKYNKYLISCSIPPFPYKDERLETVGYEAIGSMAGVLYERPLKSPKLFSFPIGSVMAAMYAANSIIAALIFRNNTGKGQHIETSIYESAMFAQMLQILVLTGAPRSFMPLKMVSTPFMGSWKCADGRYIYVHITMPSHNAKMIKKFQELGYLDELRELRKIMSPSTMEDPSMVKDINEARGIQKILRKIYLSKTADEWESILGDEFCAIKIRTLDEWIKDSMESDMQDCVEMVDPDFGPIYAPGPAVIASQYSPKIAPREFIKDPIPDLAELWPSEKRVCIPSEQNENHSIETMHNKQGKIAPLSGYKVLDLSRIIAGPFAARVLAEFGAEVISIQSPKSLDWALSFHVVFNTGKKSVTLNLADDTDKNKLWELIRHYQPNVIVQNYRNLEITKEIGIDYENMKKEIPDIAYAYLNAYGISGGWQNRPAFEQIVQAVTGIQMEYVKKGKPKIVPIAILDMGAGLLGAYASLLGLYNQQVHHQSTFINTHMTTMAMFFQILTFSSFQLEKCLAYAQKDKSIFNWDIEKKIYATILKSRTRTFCISGRRSDIRAWMKIVGLVDNPDIEFEKIIEEANRNAKRRNYVYWRRQLYHSPYKDKIGIMRRYHVGNLLKDVSRYNGNLPMSIACKKDYPGLAKLTFVRTPVRFSQASLIDLDPAPIRGIHTESVLQNAKIAVSQDKGIMPYPTEKPILIWLWNFVKWGLYAMQSGTL